MKPIEPIGRFDSDSGLWIQTEDEWVCRLPNGKTLATYKGMSSDGYSIPTWIQFAFSPRFSSKAFVPAWVHDATYMAEMFQRSECDEIFYRLMLVYFYPVKPKPDAAWHKKVKYVAAIGAAKAKAWVFYKAVRVGGKAVGDKHSAYNVQQTRRFYVKLLD